MAKGEVIEIPSSPEKEENETPFRPIFCLKSKIDMKLFEEVEDCFILDFDPFDSIDIPKLNIKTENDDEDDADLSIISEKGQVACRDYPHSRNLCSKFPFDTTPHKNYCEKGYCYVCDSAVPCKYWTEPNDKHCDASEKDDRWKVLRRVSQMEKRGCQGSK